MSCGPYTLAEAQAELAEVNSAIKAVRSGQKYSIGGRSLERVPLSELIKERNYWTGVVSRLCKTGRSGPMMRRVIPHG